MQAPSKYPAVLGLDLVAVAAPVLLSLPKCLFFSLLHIADAMALRLSSNRKTNFDKQKNWFFG
jgi:hypothetical protein